MTNLPLLYVAVMAIVVLITIVVGSHDTRLVEEVN